MIFLNNFTIFFFSFYIITNSSFKNLNSREKVDQFSFYNQNIHQLNKIKMKKEKLDDTQVKISTSVWFVERISNSTKTFPIENFSLIAIATLAWAPLFATVLAEEKKFLPLFFEKMIIFVKYLIENRYN